MGIGYKIEKMEKWIVFLVFFIGISMLMAGIGRFAYESYSVGVDEVCAELKEKELIRSLKNLETPC